MAIILVSFHKPEMLLSMGTYKARMNGTPNLELRRPREVHADIPTALYEQSLFAAADDVPSFGPSIQNAEIEFRSLLERVQGSMSIGKQEDIIAYFRKTLDSFTRALVVAEATPEGRNARYMTVIQDQDRLIDELRMLHEYREQAFQENEDIVESLCWYDGEGEIRIPYGHGHIPYGHEHEHPFNKYSADYDKFIISPLDGPAALSMKVSVRSAPFHRRPVTILDSNPHWQRFLESTAEKGLEQEARLASYGDYISTCDENEEDDKKDGCMQEICDVPESSYAKYLDEQEKDLNKFTKKEVEDIKDGCVQETCDVSQSSDDEYLDKHEDDLNKFAKKEVEDIQDGCLQETCDVSQSIDDKYLDEAEVGNDVAAIDAESPLEDLEQAESNLAWYEWKLACMEGRQETPRASLSQKLSKIPPAVTVRVMNDIMEVRWYQEEVWAEAPKALAISDCELRIDMLKEEIARMKRDVTSEGSTRN